MSRARLARAKTPVQGRTCPWFNFRDAIYWRSQKNVPNIACISVGHVRDVTWLTAMTYDNFFLFTCMYLFNLVNLSMIRIHNCHCSTPIFLLDATKLYLLCRIEWFLYWIIDRKWYSIFNSKEISASSAHFSKWIRFSKKVISKYESYRDCVIGTFKHNYTINK